MLNKYREWKQLAVNKSFCDFEKSCSKKNFCFPHRLIQNIYIMKYAEVNTQIYMLYTMGGLFFLMSFSALWGPVNHLKHLFSGDRILFSAV